MPVSLPEDPALRKAILWVCAFLGLFLLLFLGGLFFLGRSVNFYPATAPVSSTSVASRSVTNQQISSPTVLLPQPTGTASPVPQATISITPSITPAPTLLPTELPATEKPHSPFWGKIAFISDRSGFFTMYLADIDHIEEAQPVPHPPEYEDVFDPTFCGKYLGFEVQKRSSFGQWIYWWDRAANTTQPVNLPTTAGLVGAPHCSPDGRYLAYTDLTVRPWKLIVVDLSDGSIALKHAAGTLAGFASWGSNNTDLYDMTFADGIYRIEQIQSFSDVSNIELSVSDGGPISSAYYPAISPDGKTLAFICQVSEGFNLCVTDPGSNAAHILDSVSGVKYKGFTLPFGTPAWSPDGNWIYYSTQAGGNLDIFRIRADGTGRENMTPDWSSNEIQPTIAW